MKPTVYDVDPQESPRTSGSHYKRAERFDLLIMFRPWGWIHDQVSGLLSAAKSDSKRFVAMNTTTTRKSLANAVYKSGSNMSKTAVISSFNRPCMESCSASADTNRDVYMYLYILPDRRRTAHLHLTIPAVTFERRQPLLRLELIVLRLRHHFGRIHGSLPLLLRLVGHLRLRHRESRIQRFART